MTHFTQVSNSIFVLINNYSTNQNKLIQAKKVYLSTYFELKRIKQIKYLATELHKLILIENAPQSCPLLAEMGCQTNGK